MSSKTKNHHELKTIECQFCGKSVSKANIKKHEGSHHASKECGFCKEIIAKSNISKHEEDCKYIFLQIYYKIIVWF